MAYDAYLHHPSGQLANDDPVFRLEEREHDRLVVLLKQKPNGFPVLRRLEDFYRDAVLPGNEARALRTEIELIRPLDTQLADRLAPLLVALEGARAKRMNLHFAAD